MEHTETCQIVQEPKCEREHFSAFLQL